MNELKQANQVIIPHVLQTGSIIFSILDLHKVSAIERFLIFAACFIGLYVDVFQRAQTSQPNGNFMLFFGKTMLIDFTPVISIDRNTLFWVHYHL